MRYTRTLLPAFLLLVLASLAAKGSTITYLPESRSVIRRCSAGRHWRCPRWLAQNKRDVDVVPLPRLHSPLCERPGPESGGPALGRSGSVQAAQRSKGGD
jgi:hypothetical protein